MAIIKCPECGKEVSDKAISCPNCAFPISKSNSDGIVRIKLGTVKTSILNGKQRASISCDQEVIWEGYVGEIAEIEIHKAINVVVQYHISIMHYGGTCGGLVDPQKGNRYNVNVRQGIMKTVMEFQRVDFLDGD